LLPFSIFWNKKLIISFHGDLKLIFIFVTMKGRK
jgi:hypothetical protein